MTFLLAFGGHKTVTKMVTAGHKRLQIRMRWSQKLHRIHRKSLACHTRQLSLKRIPSLPGLQKGRTTWILLDFSA